MGAHAPMPISSPGLDPEVGEPCDVGHPALDRLTPSAERVAEVGARELAIRGVPPRRAQTIATVARLVADGTLRLCPGGDAVGTHRTLLELGGVGDRVATQIVTRALGWPDAFPASDRALQHAAGVSTADLLLQRAERWRPWRAYAALHLRLAVAARSRPSALREPYDVARG